MFGFLENVPKEGDGTFIVELPSSDDLNALLVLKRVDGKVILKNGMRVTLNKFEPTLILYSDKQVEMPNVVNYDFKIADENGLKDLTISRRFVINDGIFKVNFTIIKGETEGIKIKSINTNLLATQTMYLVKIGNKWVTFIPVSGYASINTYGEPKYVMCCGKNLSFTHEYPPIVRKAVNKADEKVREYEHNVKIVYYIITILSILTIALLLTLPKTIKYGHIPTIAVGILAFTIASSVALVIFSILAITSTIYAFVKGGEKVEKATL